MAKKKKKSAAAEPDESFETSLERLETVLEQLEAGDLPLADALDRYAEGVERLKACQRQLEAAERRIDLLAGADADGNPVTAPFDAAATDDSPPRRSAKRTSEGKDGAAGVDDPGRLF